MLVSVEELLDIFGEFHYILYKLGDEIVAVERKWITQASQHTKQGLLLHKYVPYLDEFKVIWVGFIY